MRTTIETPSGKRGLIERSYDPKKQQLIMENAFLDELPAWIDAGTPLVPGKGTPLVTHLTLRQMHQLGADFASLKSVKMSTIQNLETSAHLRNLAPLDAAPDALAEAVKQTHSVTYATTSIEQSGHTIVDVHVDTTNAWREPLGQAMSYWKWTQARRDALLAKYALKETDEVLYNYDIIIDVVPHPRNP